ncbi:MAG: HEAT repeat domain-containing protein [Spirochaetes bacterium]|nr:HEAT repeat domain-containing protein [Spirochaetota bacterium]
MSAIIISIFPAAVLILAAVLMNESRKKHARMDKLFSAAGGSLGLKLTKGNSFNWPVLNGSINGCAVTVRCYSIPGDNRFTCPVRIFVNHRLPIGGLMGVNRESVYSLSMKSMEGEDILIGDKSFDDAMHIIGTNPWQIASLFTADIRARVLSLATRDMDINLTSTWFEIYLEGDRIQADDIVAAVRDAAAVSADLALAGDTRGRLMSIIHEDPEPGVRASAIHHLTSHLPVDDEISTLLKKTMDDVDLRVRVAAAKGLGRDGMAYLTGLLEKEKDLDDAVVMDIVRGIGKHRWTEGIPALKSLFASRTGKGLELEMLEAFRNMGDTSLCGFLLSYLDRRSGEVLRSVVGALGSCGTAEAVEPLMKLSKSPINIMLNAAVQQAIAGIQSRLGGADAGWLSVTEAAGKEGALSLGSNPGDGSLSMKRETDYATDREKDKG